MAALITDITEFSDQENKRTYSIAGHTVQKPTLLIQKRKVPQSSTANAENELQVVYGTEDAAAQPLTSKVVFTASVRFPANALSADIDSALRTFREVVTSDEFTTMVDSQDYLA